MKIIFDHQIFSSQRFGGISRYHVELIKNLDVQWDIPFFFSNNFYLKDIKTVPEFLPVKNFRGKNFSGCGASFLSLSEEKSNGLLMDSDRNAA